MKLTKLFQKVFFGMMIACLMFTTCPNIAYASTLTYEEFFSAQKEVIDEINAEYGLNIEIQPSDNANDFDASIADIDAFRVFFTVHAQEQKRMQEVVDELGESLEVLRIMPRHGTYAGDITYGGGVTTPWSGHGTVTLSASMIASVYIENGIRHAHAVRPSHSPLPISSVTSNLPNFTHYRSFPIGLTLYPSQREVTGYYTSEISYSFMSSFIYEPNFLSAVYYRIT